MEQTKAKEAKPGRTKAKAIDKATAKRVLLKNRCKALIKLTREAEAALAEMERQIERKADMTTIVDNLEKVKAAKDQLFYTELRLGLYCRVKD